LLKRRKKVVDARDKRGHDDRERDSTTSERALETLDSMFNRSTPGGMQTKLISTCSEPEPQMREVSLFPVASWVLRGGI
jgi:hypothetical protein